jgi:hypothetical protein
VRAVFRSPLDLQGRRRADDLASPKGGQPPLDPKSDLPESQTPAMSRFEQDLKTPFPESFYNSGKPITSLAD